MEHKGKKRKIALSNRETKKVKISIKQASDENTVATVDENANENVNKVEVENIKEAEIETITIDIGDISSINDLPICDIFTDFFNTEGANCAKLQELQKLILPDMFLGRDILCCADFVVERTLIVPCIELLCRHRFSKRNGTGVILLTAEREEAFSLASSVKGLIGSHNLSCGTAIDGAGIEQERDKLGKGINLLIANPHRLIEHLNMTKSFVHRNVKMIVFVNSEYLLERFPNEVSRLIQLLPVAQKCIFAKTLNSNVKKFALLTLTKPIYIESKQENAPLAELNLGYSIVESDKRFLLLHNFVRTNITKKIVVLFSSKSSCKFFEMLFQMLKIDVLNLTENSNAIEKFSSQKRGTLLATGIALRNKRVQAHWTIFFDWPAALSPIQFLTELRVVFEDSLNAILFVLPQDEDSLSSLRDAKISLTNYTFSTNKIQGIQQQVERNVTENYFLHVSAREAYRAYVHTYSTHSQNSLALKDVCRTYGLTVPPRVKSGK